MFARSATAAVTGENRRAGAENSGQRLVCLLAHLVACTHMSDLMPQNRRKLSFIVQIGEDAASDIDVSARKGESVDLLAVDDREVPLQLGPLAGMCAVSGPLR